MDRPEPFGEKLRRLRTARDMSLRDLGKLAYVSKTVICEWETGRKEPNARAAARMDDLLDAGGALREAASLPAATPAGTDLDRLRYAATHPRRVDEAAVGALHGVLANLRRLEDSLGASALIPATAGPLAVVEELADAAHGPVRNTVLDLAGQWVQFAGWLHAATNAFEQAERWYARTLEYGTEAGNRDLVATALSMRGNLAWMARRPGPVVGLSSAAAAYATSPGIRAMAAQQRARGHAMLGEAFAVDEQLDRAAVLMEEASEHPEAEPAWIYFYSPGYLQLQRGLAYRLLGRRDEAIAHLRSGLTATEGAVRGSEFVTKYVLQLAEAHAEAGDDDVACDLLAEARRVAATSGSRPLPEEIERIARTLRLGAGRVRGPSADSAHGQQASPGISP
ncbi:multiprotein-bridging factor 1 family protein [Actinoplanes sp. NPDC049681]|uniref:multiprotein-bridging factor 1 family protein n=1 Tax=Actinoplanes sp. NPDC049681 TaxID=3363905 RepID=UPI0037B9B8F1